LLKGTQKRLVKQTNNIVLDSSAVLALALKEPGGEKVEALLSLLDSGKPVRIAVSSVSWCEILTRLYRDSNSITPEQLNALLADVELVPLTMAEAELAADYSRVHPELSLGDRACLALASLSGATAWTTDKLWSKAKVGVPVEVLR
jgi:PIN domain nuclease of toxin-antitoxin system